MNNKAPRTGPTLTLSHCLLLISFTFLSITFVIVYMKVAIFNIEYAHSG